MGVVGVRLTYSSNHTSFYWWWALLLNFVKYTFVWVEHFLYDLNFSAIPINKQLYSFSYVCFTAGAAGIVFSAFYILASYIILVPKLEHWHSRQQISANKSFITWLFLFLLDFNLRNEQIDIWGLRTPFLFLEWIGLNAMLVYVMAAQGIFAGFINGWYYKNPDNNLVSFTCYLCSNITA